MGYLPPSKVRDERALQKLQVRWAGIAVLAGLSTLAAAAVIGYLWPPGNTALWVVIAGAAFTYQLIFTRRKLTLNHRSGEADLLPVFGLGSTLTMLRGLFIAWTAGFLFSPRPLSPLAWAPAILYTSAIILDLFDGYAARVRNQATNLGADLDNELDALGLLIAISLAVWYGVLPLWFLPIGLARYAFTFGIWLRQRRNLPVYELPPSTSRRPVAGLTMGFTSAMLWPVVSPPGSTLAGLLFLVPFAASFTRDWLVVSGALDSEGIRYQGYRNYLRAILFRWAPLALRVILILVLGTIIFNWINALDDSSVTSLFPVLILLLAFILIAVGFAGRFAAFVLIFPLSLAILDLGLGPLLAITLVADLGILLLGTGPYSLWQPEVTIFGRRWGAN